MSSRPHQEHFMAYIFYYAGFSMVAQGYKVTMTSHLTTSEGKRVWKTADVQH